MQKSNRFAAEIQQALSRQHQHAQQGMPAPGRRVPMESFERDDSRHARRLRAETGSFDRASPAQEPPQHEPNYAERLFAPAVRQAQQDPHNHQLRTLRVERKA